MTIGDLVRWVGNLSAWWLVPVALLLVWNWFARESPPVLDADDIADTVAGAVVASLRAPPHVNET
ncbi:MAG: hypothetical protein DMD33_18525 [Gemmatimonadetes bacterium]|nr:MAG: hypothetical protein DMD33_18525 [Gemmatimonadota bacterium]